MKNPTVKVASAMFKTFTVLEAKRGMLSKLSQSNQRSKILFFKIGAIGDVLMTTPLVRAVRKKYPKAHITYATGKWSVPVVEGNKSIDEVITFDEKKLFKKNILYAMSIASKIRKNQYNTCFVLDKTWLAGLLAWKFDIPERIGFNRNGEGFANTVNVDYEKRKHEIEYYLELGKKIGVRHDALQMDLTISNTASMKMKKIVKKPFVVIAPGGAENPGQKMPSRRWPLERFHAVAKHIQSKGYNIILIGGHADTRFASGFGSSTSLVNLIGKTSLQESAAVMKMSKLVICNDSGPMHIAAASGAKVLSIFGPTDPVRKAPVGNEHKYIWHKIDCQKAELHGVYKKEHMKNIQRVTVAEVIMAADKMLKYA